jgi:hypothetical protein
MSDSNPSAPLERTSSIVYDADIFNCSRHLPMLSLSTSPDSLSHFPARAKAGGAVFGGELLARRLSPVEESLLLAD